MKKFSQMLKKNTLVFSRWSRKAFASFCSIGRCVVISKVKKEIADASLTKNTSLSDGYMDLNPERDYLQDEDNPLTGINILLTGFTDILLFKNLNVTFASAGKGHSSYIYNLNIHIYGHQYRLSTLQRYA